MSNLRIKNKRLKRELELLKGQSIRPTLVYDRREIVKLRSRHTYDDSLCGCIPEDIIVREAISGLADEVKPYIRLNSYRDYVTGNLVVEAELDVVQ